MYVDYGTGKSVIIQVYLLSCRYVLPEHTGDVGYDTGMLAFIQVYELSYRYTYFDYVCYAKTNRHRLPYRTAMPYLITLR